MLFDCREYTDDACVDLPLIIALVTLVEKEIDNC